MGLRPVWAGGQLRVTVPGEPVAWARARRRGNRYFNGERQNTQSDLLAEAWNFGQVEGPVGVTLRFYLSRPKSHCGTGRNAGRLKPSAPRLAEKRPDVDNLAKLVLDALQEHAWADDAQIVTLIAEKRYGTPRTEIEVEPLSAN